MSRRQLPPLGSIFLVPLRDKGFAAGVLARANGRGQAFGYFFGPRIQSLDAIEPNSLRPDGAILVGKFGDLELFRGRGRGNWPIGPVVPGWRPSDWPMGPMARTDEEAGRAWVSTYDDEFKCIGEIEVPPAEAARYPYDQLMGAGSVEIRLTRAIAREEGNVNSSGDPGTDGG